jgi:hypothetical protein
MDEYRRTVPWWKRAYKHSLTQMMLLSVQAFCGPAMWDAIAGLLPPYQDIIRMSTMHKAVTHYGYC